MTYPKSHYLRNLSDLDVQNLKASRITRQAMGEARDRAVQVLKSNPYHDEDMLLADELNDMLEASKGGER